MRAHGTGPRAETVTLDDEPMCLDTRGFEEN